MNKMLKRTIPGQILVENTGSAIIQVCRYEEKYNFKEAISLAPVGSDNYSKNSWGHELLAVNHIGSTQYSPFE